jgi:hypothetical protein
MPWDFDVILFSFHFSGTGFIISDAPVVRAAAAAAAGGP